LKIFLILGNGNRFLALGGEFWALAWATIALGPASPQFLEVPQSCSLLYTFSLDMGGGV